MGVPPTRQVLALALRESSMVEDEVGFPAIRSQHEFDNRVVARAPAAGTPSLYQALVLEQLQDCDP